MGLEPGERRIMDQEIRYRSMRAGEEAEVSRLALDSFNEFVAPGYTSEGVAEIHGYFEETSIRARQGSAHFVLVAEAAGKIVGMIEVRDNAHISMLFVAERRMREGIGGELVRRGIDRARTSDPAVKAITVNASPYAVPPYERLGFQAADAEQCVNGIRFIPMRMTLEQED